MFNVCPSCQSPANSNENPFVCSECGFTLYRNTAAAVIGIIFCDGEVLMTTRAKEPGKNQLDLPGGFVDPEESLEDATVREIQEELGVSITDWQYLCSYPNEYPFKGLIYHTCDAVFYSEVNHKPEINRQRSEIADTHWVAIDDINLSEVAFESVRKALKKFAALQRKS